MRGIIFDLSRNNVWPAPFTGRCLINDHARRWIGREVELMQNVAAVAVDYAAAKAAGNFDVAAVIAGEAVGLIDDIPRRPRSSNGLRPRRSSCWKEDAIR